jgi:hypothetical protein
MAIFNVISFFIIRGLLHMYVYNLRESLNSLGVFMKLGVNA